MCAGKNYFEKIFVYFQFSWTGKKNSLKISSFKFAGNALFGDGFKGNVSSENRMLKKYTTHFNELFESNGLDQLQKTLKNIFMENQITTTENAAVAVALC